MRAVAHKEQAAAIVRELGFAFTVNAVLHRANIDRIGDIIELAARLGADRIELANTQYYGWGLVNRNALLPTREQVLAAQDVADEAKLRHKGRMQIVYVLPDYHETYPKPCYAGWGHVYFVITPDGRALPCHGATEITTLAFDNVRERSLEWIWSSVAGVRDVPRRCVDEGAVPVVSAQGGRLRWLPLPGVRADRRRRQHRSRAARSRRCTTSSSALSERRPARRPTCTGIQRANRLVHEAGEPAIHTIGLGRDYGATRALEALDLTVPVGSIVGLLGPNGAGKTTTMLLLATLLGPSRGTATVFGHDTVRARSLARRRLGLVFQEASIDGTLTVAENLLFAGRLMGLRGEKARRAVAEALERNGPSRRAPGSRRASCPLDGGVWRISRGRSCIDRISSSWTSPRLVSIRSIVIGPGAGSKRTGARAARPCSFRRTISPRRSGATAWSSSPTAAWSPPTRPRR